MGTEDLLLGEVMPVLPILPFDHDHELSVRSRLYIHSFGTHRLLEVRKPSC